jgi:hypothetical protein
MLFLNADFWPLFWAVIGGGAGLTAVLSLFATTAPPLHRAPTARPAETAAPRAHQPAPHRAHEPVHIRRAA